jgi:hypothetical protein
LLNLEARYDYEDRETGSAWLGENFSYVWSELSVTGPEWLRVGLVPQRTKLFEPSTQVQVGPLVGGSFWKISATAYLFAPGQPDQFVVVALAGAF